ncbi:MAG TPA: ABC transporter permease [Anaerolineae bacterium]|nr:ABC transporter permease [Anaerolineae bacterium]
MNRTLQRTLPPTMLIVLLIVLWQVVTTEFDIPEWLLPSPWAIVQAGWRTAPLLTPHTAQTLLETAIGLVLALMTGVLLAVAIDLSSLLRRTLYPLLVASQTVPIIAIAPLLIVWFGYGILPKVVVVALVCFFPIAVNTADGLRGADPDFVALLRAMGASRWAIFTRVRVPSSLPSFFSGLKIAATYSVIGAVIGEWVGASKGLGIYMLRSSNAFRTAQLFAAIVVTSLLSIALFLLVSGLEHWLLPWYYTAQREEQWESLR